MTKAGTEEDHDLLMTLTDLRASFTKRTHTLADDGALAKYCALLEKLHVRLCTAGKKPPIKRLVALPVFFGDRKCYPQFCAAGDVWRGSANPIAEIAYVLMQRSYSFYCAALEATPARPHELRCALTLVNGALALAPSYEFEVGMPPVLSAIGNIRAELIVELLLCEEHMPKLIDRALLVYDELTRTNQDQLPSRRAAVAWLSEYVDACQLVKEGRHADVADRIRALLEDLGNVSAEDKPLWRHCFACEEALRATNALCTAVKRKMTQVDRPLPLTKRVPDVKGSIDAFSKKLSYTLTPEFTLRVP